MRTFGLLPLPPSMADWLCWDHGKLWIAPEFADSLQKAGLTTLEALMTTHQGTQYKANRFREVWRIELDNMLTVFLKRHFRTTAKESISSLLHGHPAHSAARQELWAIHHIQSLGISTLRAVAFGEMPFRFHPGHSVLLTQEVADAVKLEKYLRDPHAIFYQNFQMRLALTRQLANIAHTLHTNRLHHQDFYLGHLLLSWLPTPQQKQELPLAPQIISQNSTHEPASQIISQNFTHELTSQIISQNSTHEPDSPNSTQNFIYSPPQQTSSSKLQFGFQPFKITLIDLQRVQQRKKLALRWVVKDLAQLAYSASLVPFLHKTDYLRFFLLYKNSPQSWTTSDRKMLQAIQRKFKHIAKHDIKVQARKQKLNNKISLSFVKS